MKKIIFLVVILLIPVCAGAAFTIYLKNGSVISDVRSYKETGEEMSVYFQTGAMVIPRRDILRITGRKRRLRMPLRKRHRRPETGRSSGK